jgi:hypothetical protein
VRPVGHRSQDGDALGGDLEPVLPEEGLGIGDWLLRHGLAT